MSATRRRQLDRLMALARQAPRTSEIPTESKLTPGLATRVAARWATGESEFSVLGLWDRAAGWGTLAASVVCVSALLLTRFEARAPSAFDDFLTGATSEAAGGIEAHE